MGDNDNREPAALTLPLEQVRLLAAAGDVLSQLWGDLAAGDAITLGDLNERLDEAGLLEESDDGVSVLAPALVDAVVDVDVAAAHLQDEIDGFLLIDEGEGEDEDDADAAADVDWADDAAFDRREPAPG